MTALTWPGSTRIVARSRKYTVSSTASGSSLPISWARSSRPVASGTRGVPRPEHVLRVGARTAPALGHRADHLLGPLGAVALPPSELGVAQDHRSQPQDTMDQRLRPRGATGNVNVHRHELVGRDHRVVVE